MKLPGHLKRSAALVLAALLSACATVDFDASREPSFALTDTSDTRLGRNFAPEREEFHPKSGFYPLFQGIDALAARLLIISRAEKSIDAQYYLVGDDPIGDLFFAALLDAADRGVRVRLLIDDIGTRSIEDRLGPLDSHPNLELRLFNPFASRGVRALDAWDGLRLNRRMHNKLLTADNEIAIIGGRNIASEYFSLNPAFNFGDLDVAAIGTVVRESSRMFDSYWNDRLSVPYRQLVDGYPAESDIAAMRSRLMAVWTSLRETPYAEVVGERLAALADTDTDEYYWTRYALVYDDPDKAFAKGEDAPQKITESLGGIANAAESELMVISPYFVPRKPGIEWLSGLSARGVQVDVLTNGLAANDHIYVYGGYAPVRKPLLKAGVRFYELRGNLEIEGTSVAGTVDADSKLHGKAFIVDRRYLFIGSFNWDPRSANLNTEMGVVMDSPDFSAALVAGVYDKVDEFAYEVFLNEDAQIRWRTTIDGVEKVFDKEPESTWWKRTKANLTRLLPIRGQL